jgi:hypothetical protein
VVLYCHKLFLKHFSISSTFTLPGSYDWHLPLCKHLCSSCRTFISYMLLYFHLKILSVKQKHMFTPALHENYNTINFERIKINIRSLWSVSIMPCHSLYLWFLSFSIGFIYSSFFLCVGRWNSVLLIHLLAFVQVNSFLSSQLRMLLLDFISTINALFNKRKISARVSVYWANSGSCTSSPDMGSFYAFNQIGIKGVQVLESDLFVETSLCFVFCYVINSN